MRWIRFLCQLEFVENKQNKHNFQEREKKTYKQLKPTLGNSSVKLISPVNGPNLAGIAYFAVQVAA